MDAKLEYKFSNQCSIINEDFCSRSRPAKKIIAGIFLTFRGLFFEHNPREMGFAFHRAGTETCPPHRQRHLRPADWAKRPFKMDTAKEQVELHCKKPLNRFARMH